MYAANVPSRRAVTGRVVVFVHWEAVEAAAELMAARVALEVVYLAVASHLKYCLIRYCYHAHWRYHSQSLPSAQPPC